MKKKWLALLVAAAMVLSTTAVGFAAGGGSGNGQGNGAGNGNGNGNGAGQQVQSSFQDTGKHWAKSQIEKWCDKGILKGSNGNFRPDDSVTRGEFAVILDRVMKYEAAEDVSFQDLSGDEWYADSICKLAKVDVLKGNNGNAMPKSIVTRQEATVLFARALSIEPKDGNTGFTDDADIDSWAKGYVLAMSDLKYVSGKAGAFCPDDPIARAEVVKMLDNLESLFPTTEKPNTDKDKDSSTGNGQGTGDGNGNAAMVIVGATLADGTVVSGASITEKKPVICVEFERGITDNFETNKAQIVLMSGDKKVDADVTMKTNKEDTKAKSKVYITPKENLSAGQYTVKVLKEFKANNGNILGQDIAYPFTVK